ncbi:MAG: hypothetical protein EOO56_24835 [Hymenobacter sp.]|nr:MAG: hypothetical protein EOO56_24835 [Hymenobacter sp.]
MEPSSVPVRAKRGCLWYIGVAVAGTFALFVLFIVGLILFVHNDLGQHSTVVSATDQTYLESETSNHGEGFLDGYDWLEVYYVRSGWVWNKRVMVCNIPHASASHVGFHRRLNQNGQLQIEIMQGGTNGDSAVVATFVPPATFPDE